MPDSRLRVNLRAFFHEHLPLFFYATRTATRIEHASFVGFIHLAATAPKTALSHVSADSGGKLLPDFVAAGPEQIAEKAHSFGDDFNSAAADRL